MPHAGERKLRVSNSGHIKYKPGYYTERASKEERPYQVSPRFTASKKMIDTARKCISGKRTFANTQVHKLYKILYRGKCISDGIDEEAFTNRINDSIMQDVRLARMIAYMDTKPEFATDQAFEEFFRLMKKRGVIHREMTKKDFKKLIDAARNELEEIEKRKQNGDER